MPMEENEPLSSDEEISSKKITLEHVIEECGSFGRYQYLHFFFLSLFPIASGIIGFYYIFGAAETPYTCHVNEKFPSNISIKILESECSYRLINDLNQTLGEFSCTKWTYDESIFGQTFTAEANFICKNSFYRSFLSTMLQLGAMLIFFTGQLTDIIGRRRSAQALVILLLATFFITQSLLQWAPLSINYKFILILINQFVSGIDTFIIAYILLIELTTSIHATWVANLALVTFTLGEMILAGMAYLCRHWLLLKWAITIYVLALVPYLIFIPESPHWLLTKHRYNELEMMLRRMAQINRQPESKWLPFYRYLIEYHRKQKDINQQNKIKLSFFAKIRRFLTHIPTMTKLFISSILGFVTLLIYIKISYSLGAMTKINPYLNIVIGAFVEAFGYIAASLFMMRLGRKPVMIVFLVPTMICLLLILLIGNQDNLIVVFIAQFGKFSISGAVCVTYILIPELFPTSIRATGMGIFVLFSRIGSTLAPIIDSLISHNTTLITYMYCFYTALMLLCIILTLLLPETRNIPLADKIDYHKKQNAKNSSNINE